MNPPVTYLIGVVAVAACEMRRTPAAHLITYVVPGCDEQAAQHQHVDRELAIQTIAKRIPGSPVIVHVAEHGKQTIHCVGLLQLPMQCWVQQAYWQCWGSRRRRSAANTSIIRRFYAKKSTKNQYFRNVLLIYRCANSCQYIGIYN